MASSLLALAPPIAHAYCLTTTAMPLPGNTCVTEGEPLKWPRQCISFSVMNRGEPEPPLERVRTIADVSFSTWTDVTCDGQPVGLDIRQTVELAECDEPEYNRHAPNANTIMFVFDWHDRGLPLDAFALTLVWHNPRTGTIYDADMQLNETLGRFSDCDESCPPGAVDLQNVITHEAGHFLGLGHSEVDDSTMSARATLGETRKRDLTQDDFDGLCALYARYAEPSCEDEEFTPNHGFGTKCAPPLDDDCSVSAPGARRSAAVVWPSLLVLAACIRYRSSARKQHRAR
jgi:hypothetical protein